MGVGGFVGHTIDRLYPLAIPYVDDVWKTVQSSLPASVFDFVEALTVVLIAYVAARLLVRVFGRRIARRSDRPSVTRMTIRGIKATIYVIAFFAILQIYGLKLSQIALSVTVFTAVLGVVLAPIVGSFISGVFLLADQPYEIGDMIEIVDTEQRGFVEDITLRYTKIFTLDNTFVVIPNGTIRERDVMNYSAEDTRTRQTMTVVVTYEGNLAQARRLLEDAARQVDIVVKGGPGIRVGSARYPASPTCYISDFGDHGIHLKLRYWVEEPYRLTASRSKIMTEIWDRIEDADVEIAYPHSHVVFDDTSGELSVSTRAADSPAPEAIEAEMDQDVGASTQADAESDASGERE